MDKFFPICAVFICFLNLTSGIEADYVEVRSEKEILGEESYPSLGLKLHNQFRSKHGAPELKLNETLSSAAQSYAESLIRSNTFKNRLEPGYVKNLYQYRGTFEIKSIDAIEHALTKWYATMADYNWSKPNVTPFSALVWKSTTDVGFGLSRRGTRTVIVAAYSPPGNILGDNGDHFRDNVLRSQ